MDRAHAGGVPLASSARRFFWRVLDVIAGYDGVSSSRFRCCVGFPFGVTESVEKVHYVVPK